MKLPIAVLSPKWIKTGALLGVSGAIVTVYAAGGFPKSSKVMAQQVATPKSIYVQTATAKLGTIAQTLALTGSVVSPQSISLSPRGAGNVQSISVHVGQTVRANQVLAQLANGTAQAQLLVAQGGLASALGKMAQARQSINPYTLALASANVQVAGDKLQTLMAGAAPAKITQARAAVSANAQSVTQLNQQYAWMKSSKGSQALALADAEHALSALKSGQSPLALAVTNAEQALQDLTNGSAPQNVAVTVQQANATASTAALQTAEGNLQRTQSNTSPQGIAVASDQTTLQTDQQNLVNLQGQLQQAEAGNGLSATVQQSVVSAQNTLDTIKSASSPDGIKVTQDQQALAASEATLTSLQAQTPVTTTLQTQIASAETAVTNAQDALSSDQAAWNAAIAAAQNQLNQASAAAQTANQNAVSALQNQISAAQEAVVSAQSKLATDQANWTNAISVAADQVNAASAAISQQNLANQGKLSILQADQSQAMQIAARALATAKAQYAQALRTDEQAVQMASANEQTALQRMQATLQKAQATLLSSRDNLAALQAPPQPSVLAAAKTAIAAAKLKVEELLHPKNQGTLQALQGAVTAAQGRLQIAQQALSNTVIAAPFPGVITAITAQPGNAVTAAKPIIAMIGTTLELQAQLSQQDINQVHPGERVLFTLPFAPSQNEQGVVASISPVVNPQTLSLTVTIAPARPIVGMASGETASIQVVTKSDPHAVLVPTAAINSQTGAPQVYLVKNGRALLRPVTLGATQGAWTEVLAGVSAGDQVVTLGQTFLAPGDHVTVSNVIARASGAVTAKPSTSTSANSSHAAALHKGKHHKGKHHKGKHHKGKHHKGKHHKKPASTSTGTATSSTTAKSGGSKP